MIFLVVYDIKSRKLLRVEEFKDVERDRARQTCKEEQDTLVDQLNDIEIVLFEASSRDELMKTHSRYFSSLPQLDHALDKASTEGQERIFKRLNSV